MVVSSHSLRDRTQQEKLDGRSGARCWGIFGWLAGKGEVGTPIVGDDVRTGVAGLANGPGHDRVDVAKKRVHSRSIGF